MNMAECYLLDITSELYTETETGCNANARLNATLEQPPSQSLTSLLLKKKLFVMTPHPEVAFQ